jgi:hypothetical protein
MIIDFLSIFGIRRNGMSPLPAFPSDTRARITKADKQKSTIPHIVTVLAIAVCAVSLLIASLANTLNVYAANNTDSSDINPSSLIVTKQGSFIDAGGRLNIVGVVDNIGHVPVQVNMGLKTKDKDTGLVTTKILPTFGKIIYPLTGAPFKFVVASHNSSPLTPNKAYISSVKEVPTPYFKTLRLNYTNTPVGKDRSLVGTVKNIGPVDVHDVSVFASAHDNKTRQIDSVKSKVIPVIKPGEEVPFSATPDPTEGPKILYYSCAEIDLHPGGFNTLDMGNGKSIAYDLHGIVSVSDFKYVNSTDSLVFGVKHWNPTGGPMSLKIIKESGVQNISVLMDGKMNNKNDVSINKPVPMPGMDPQEADMNFNLSPGNHDIQIKGL